MKITIESTTKIIELKTPTGSVPARIWQGATESGVPVHAYVTRIAVDRAENTEQFERELTEQRAPSAEIAAFPARLVL